MSNLNRWLVTGCVLLMLVGLTWVVLRSFLVPVLWAVILVYVTWPVHAWLRRRWGEHHGSIALVMTLVLSSLVVIPLIWGSLVLHREMAEFLRQMPAWLEQKPTLPRMLLGIPYIGPELARHLDRFDDLNALVRATALPRLQALSNDLLGVAEGVGRNLAKLGMTALAVFFAYRDGSDWARQVRLVLIHVLGERADHYLQTAESTVKAVVYGIVLTAIGQGLVAGLGYWAVGIGAPIILSLVTMAVAMIPFGTPFVWIGASLWLLVHGEPWAAVSLALWGALVVSWVDNVIRPLVISATTRIPFLLVLFGVLGGLLNFGFIGLFLGPVILAIALAVWREWLQALEQQPAG